MPLSQLMAPAWQQDKVQTPYPSLKTLYDLALFTLFTSPILFLAAALSYTHAEPLSDSPEPCPSCIWASCQPGTSSSAPSTGELVNSIYPSGLSLDVASSWKPSWILYKIHALAMCSHNTLYHPHHYHHHVMMQVLVWCLSLTKLQSSNPCFPSLYPLSWV